jgi:prepilin-type processing-associated H-X9-DG protein
MNVTGRAVVEFAQKHAGRFPASLSELAEGDMSVFSGDSLCPGAVAAGNSVPHVYWGAGLRYPPDASVVVLTEPLSNHAGKGMNVCFADGTVKFIDAKSAKKLLAELEAGHNPPRNWP